jgi:predicted ABC-type ATPase
MATHKQRRKRHRNKRPRCIVIAGPKWGRPDDVRTSVPPGIARVVHFVNADLIAGGLSPLRPELAVIAAARMVLREFDLLASERSDIALESTLGGRICVRRLDAWRRAGYRIEIVFLRLSSIDLALRRVEVRVSQAGHAYPSVMFSDTSSVAGKTSKKSTDPWGKPGRCTTI